MGGVAHDAMFALTGSTGWYQYGVTDNDAARIYDALTTGKAVVAGTNSRSVAGELVTAHMYSVVALWSDGTWENFWVQVRNPWGKDGAAPSGDPSDGLIWVRWSDFKASMDYLNIR